MTEQSDYMAIGQRAAESAKETAIDTVRQIKASVINRPAWGKENTKKQRIDMHRMMLQNPLAMEEEYDAVSQRFAVPEGHVPVRWGEYGVLARRDLESEAEDAD